MKNYGFIAPKIDESQDYILGAYTKLGADVVRADGQWDDLIPVFEAQSRPSLETYNCTAFATLNCLEMLFRAKYGTEENWSDRYTGIQAGTSELGNDPSKVIESIRKHHGLLEEFKLPFSDNVKTIQEYYSPKPVPSEMEDDAKRILNKWKIGHEFVFGNQAAMKEALRYSPLGVAVYAWAEQNGLFVRLGNDSHWTVIYGYEDGKYWKCYDSYEREKKKLAWDFGFRYVKRYHIEPKNDASLIEQILKLYEKAISLLVVWANKTAPVVEPPAITPPSLKPDYVSMMAKAIEEFEGFAPGTRSYRNNNSGNLKYTSYTKELGATGKDERNFCIFESYEAGYGALCQFIEDAARNKLRAYHDKDFVGFFESFAPSTDGNKPKKYAEYVASRCGLPPSTKIKDLV